MAASSFAKIAVLGNLGSDPETRYTTGGNMVVSFSIAVNPIKQDSGPATWYRVSAWDKLADRIDKLYQQGYIVKGRPLFIEGRFEPREYKANDGQTRISYDVTMTDFNFIGSGQADDQKSSGSGYGGGDDTSVPF